VAFLRSALWPSTNCDAPTFIVLGGFNIRLEGCRDSSHVTIPPIVDEYLLWHDYHVTGFWSPNGAEKGVAKCRR